MHPGAAPTFPVGSTAENYCLIVAEHERFARVFALYHDTDKTLKRLLLAAFPAVYLAEHRDPVFDFSNFSTLTLLTHLWDKYGTITPDVLHANTTRLLTPFWNAADSIESLFEIIDSALLLQAIYLNVEASGPFHLRCKAWRLRPPTDRTYALGKTFFRAAYQDKQRVTASSLGYHSADQATVPTLCTLAECTSALKLTVSS